MAAHISSGSWGAGPVRIHKALFRRKAKSVSLPRFWIFWTERVRSDQVASVEVVGGVGKDIKVKSRVAGALIGGVLTGGIGLVAGAALPTSKGARAHVMLTHVDGRMAVIDCTVPEAHLLLTLGK